MIKITFTEKYTWYTPMEYIDAARKVMGLIDLDPATDEVGQARIKANQFFTKENDGLANSWFGNVWLAPPYYDPVMSKFIFKAIKEYENNNVSQVIILINTNTTWVDWFQAILSKCDAACFVSGKIQWVPGHTSSGFPPYSEHGSVFFYFGQSVQTFCDVFKEFGWIMKN